MEFDNFKPQPIVDVIQQAGNIDDKELFATFNMGWGFAVIVSPEHANSVDGEVIGKVTDNTGHIVVKHKGKEHLMK